ncbi:MAG: hypothetical protein H6618_06325 [Deltaproteobacteria bacterium]|nr:hypothetical protein [Deltaproteobacteria bacterium]
MKVWKGEFRECGITDRLVNPCLEIQLKRESYRSKTAATNKNNQEGSAGNR